MRFYFVKSFLGHSLWPMPEENSLANIRNLFGCERLGVLARLFRLRRVECVDGLCALFAVHSNYVFSSHAFSVCRERVDLNGTVVEFGCGGGHGSTKGHDIQHIDDRARNSNSKTL